MNEHSKHNTVLYITLTIAIVALVVGSIGLIRSGHATTSAPQPYSGLPSQQLPGGPGMGGTGPITTTPGGGSGSVDSNGTVH